MSKRIAAIRKILTENHLDGFLITKQQNWQYLSGFTGSNAVLIMTPNENCLITDFRYIEQAVEQAPAFQIIRPAALMEDAVVEQVKKLGLGTVGFEDDNLTYNLYTKYTAKLANVQFVPAHRQLERLRQVKDHSEIEAIRKAAAITDDAFDHILSFVRPGVRESEIALELEYFMRRRGAQKTAFEIIVASGPRGALPHGVASEKELQPGDLVVMDFGAVCDGYHSDMTRTVLLGKADSKQSEIYHLVLRAQEKAIKAVKPGVKCSTVDLVARDLITVEGYGANFGHGLGHSVGLEIHEKPSLAPKDDTVLQPGMVITVEPGIYLSGWGGVRIEDLVLVTSRGREILSKSPKVLLELC